MAFEPDNNCSLFNKFTDDDFILQYCNDSSVREFCLNACQNLFCDESLEDDSASKTTAEIVLDIAVKILTFLLISGFAATVDISFFFENFKSKGVYIGLLTQFIMMPLLGFLAVLIFRKKLGSLESVILIVVTACPGGAYSNWFCSMFNADLSLSVAMTTTSTLLAAVFLPLNVLLYVKLGFENIESSGTDEDIVTLLPYSELFITLSVVIAGVFMGLLYSYRCSKLELKRKHKFQHRANFVGNVAGILLQLVGLSASSTSCAPPWEQSGFVFLAVATPLLCGILFSLIISRSLSLPKPQQVAIAIECGYQNTGIAVAIALSLGSRGRAATVIPITYGILESVFYFPFCFFAVYAGWTLSPKGESIIKILFNDYQDTIPTHPHYRQWVKKHPSVLIAEGIIIVPDDTDETQNKPTGGQTDPSNATNLTLLDHQADKDDQDSDVTDKTDKRAVPWTNDDTSSFTSNQQALVNHYLNDGKSVTVNKGPSNIIKESL